MTPARPAPSPELADVVRRFGPLLPRLTGHQRRVLGAIAACRTAAMGGHVETCDRCRHERVAYNSCRNRHCPKCQGSACARWMEARAQDLLPVEYFHVVFTLPSALRDVALANRRVVYGILFEAAARTLMEVAAHPKRLAARIGITAILHTWGQNLQLHPHLHCVVPGGGISLGSGRWVPCRPGFFLPVHVLSRVFRGKFLDLLRRAFRRRGLRGVADAAEFEAIAAAAARSEWVVYAKRPFGGPRQVLKYLSRYTHRIAISNRRLISMDDRTVTFGWKDYANAGRRRTMTLEGTEFLRRFLMHVVPAGFMRIRHFGFLANRVRRASVDGCRAMLGNTIYKECEPRHPAALATAAGTHQACPACGDGHMIPGEWVRPRRPLGLTTARNDTS